MQKVRGKRTKGIGNYFLPYCVRVSISLCIILQRSPEKNNFAIKNSKRFHFCSKYSTVRTADKWTLLLFSSTPFHLVECLSSFIWKFAWLFKSENEFIITSGKVIRSLTFKAKKILWKFITLSSSFKSLYLQEIYLMSLWVCNMRMGLKIPSRN